MKNRKLFYLMLYCVCLLILSATGLQADSLKVELRNVTNHLLTNGVWFGTNDILNDPAHPFISGPQYVLVDYCIDTPSDIWNIQMYTYNTNYTGSGSGAGLVHQTDPGRKLPVLWRIYGQLQTNRIQATNTTNWASMRDKSDGFFTPDNLDYSIVHSSGVLAELMPYPESGRYTAVTNPLYLYLAADCREALSRNMSGTYDTTVYLDFNHFVQAGLGLDSVTPDTGFSSERSITLTIKGSGFQSGALVTLVKAGQPDISAGNAVVTSDTILADFDLTRAVLTGYYDLVVKNPDTRTAVLPEVFRIQGYDMTGNRLVPVNNYFKPSENSSVNIKWCIEQAGNVDLMIFNLKGEVVKTFLDNTSCKAGVFQHDWDGSNDSNKKVASGIYFVKIRAGKFTDTKKIVVVK
ncbi:MAG: FlgD immunoglobulin-like domain containing protein [bacterium]|nr:FlgD immunoglobulin-like domain containing protein [bacterium]